MSSKSILLLKAAPEDGEKDKYLNALEQLGFSVTLVPVIVFNFVNRESLASSLSHPHQFSGLIFTSKRSVEAVREASGPHFTDDWRDKPVYVVGGGTGQAVLSMLGLTNIRGEDTGKAESLAELIVRENGAGTGKYLFPKGNLARDILPSVLSSNGIATEEVVAYQTEANPHLKSLLSHIAIPEYVVIFSPSGGAASLPILKELHGDAVCQIKFIAIGKTTESEIVRLGFSVFHVLEKPSPECLVAIMK